jgi:hypothetical protein
MRRAAYARAGCRHGLHTALLSLMCLLCLLRPHAEHDPDWDDKKHRLGAKMLKLRGMLGQLRQAASSEP